MGKRLKAQSAMEYLMTYGWAILIIAVVLGALFSLGVFSGSSLLGTSCIASPGYYCQNPVLTPNPSGSGSVLTFNFGQNTGATVYNAILCAEPQSQSPSQSSALIFGGNNCTAPNTYLTLASGQTISPSIPLSFSGSIGTPFTGYVWLAYNGVSSSGQANLIAKVATIIVKVS
ncbi:MAG: hypothetical protein RXP92_01205 [Candidatus Micrarchaeota archaeon]